MHKAEDALIGARHRLNRFKFQTKWFPLATHKCNRAILSLDGSSTSNRRRLKLEIDHIEKRLPVQFRNLVARLESNARCQGIRFDSEHTQTLCLRTSMCRGMTIFMNRLQGLA